ncbi:unnamed protein product [Phytophthora lilii]|uniref:Unnamed protein product n=1 Tax=Phytophthora lilii TaxID=2077276 RepID=A0A9W6YFI8_9STRA|nr:unnamed protein product [Phytophthora lilii]
MQRIYCCHSLELKTIFAKTSGLNDKLSALRKNPAINGAIEKNSGVQKLAPAAKSDPDFFKKLGSNPDAIKKLPKDHNVVKISSMLEKNSVKLTKGDLKKLEKVVATDRMKSSRLQEGLKLAGRLALGGGMVGIVVILVYLLIAPLR